MPDREFVLDVARRSWWRNQMPAADREAATDWLEGILDDVVAGPITATGLHDPAGLLTDGGELHPGDGSETLPGATAPSLAESEPFPPGPNWDGLLTITRGENAAAHWSQPHRMTIAVYIWLGDPTSWHLWPRASLDDPVYPVILIPLTTTQPPLRLDGDDVVLLQQDPADVEHEPPTEVRFRTHDPTAAADFVTVANHQTVQPARLTNHEIRRRDTHGAFPPTLRKEGIGPADSQNPGRT